MANNFFFSLGLGGGWTTPNGHGVASAAPDWPHPMATQPTIFFFFFFSLGLGAGLAIPQASRGGPTTPYGLAGHPWLFKIFFNILFFKFLIILKE
jgi:hypothetical protein